MARLLIRAKAPHRGQISVAKPDGHVFGAMEDISQYAAKHGSRADWPGDFIVLDLVGMSVAEAERLAAPVVIRSDGPIDPITNLPSDVHAIPHNSKGLLDIDAMANTSARRDNLRDDFSLSRRENEVQANITERS